MLNTISVHELYVCPQPKRAFKLYFICQHALQFTVILALANIKLDGKVAY